MKFTKLIVALLSLGLKLAERDRQRAIKEQADYRADMNKLADKLREERNDLELRLIVLHSDIATANAKATIGSNQYNEDERNAGRLVRTLSATLEDRV